MQVKTLNVTPVANLEYMWIITSYTENIIDFPVSVIREK